MSSERMSERVLVVLRPPTKESPLEVVVEQPSDRNGGPNVGKIVRSPAEPTEQEDGGMQVLENLPLLAKEMERNWKDRANEEKPQETVVQSASAEHPLGPEGSPEDGSGEGGVDIRAGELEVIVLI